jgi:hypothetical protein
MEKLPSLELAKSGYRLVYYNWQSMVRLGLIPFAVILGVALLNAILGTLVASSAATGNAGAAVGLGFLSLLLNLVSLAAIVPFLVAWTRFTFDVSDGRMPDVSLAVGKTELVYFGWLIALGVAIGIVYAIASVLLVPLAAVGGVVLIGLVMLFVILPGVLYLSMRFAFVFPEVALERRTDPLQSWRQTAKDHVELWLLGLAVIVPMIVVGIVLSLIGVGLAFIPVLGVILTIALHVLAMAVYIAFIAAFTSAVSLAHRRVVG